MAGDRWLTFDCYGTLADWNACIRTALAPLAGPSTALMLAAYHQAELTLEARPPWRPYREILASGVRLAARELGITLGDPAGGTEPGHGIPRQGADPGAGRGSGRNPGRAGADDPVLASDPAAVLVRAWPTMTLFDDVAPALRTLAADGWRLAILTNCDDDLFATTAPRLPVEFDVVVTAEQARSYKPDLGHFQRFAELTGATPENWIHVGNSWVHDVLPASRMGLRSVWVDRDLTGHPAKTADRRITAMRRLPETVADVSVLPAPSLA
jgi:2-haloacid dehalogenase